jgi:hypothetical protein
MIESSQRYPVDTGNRGDIPNPATLETDTSRLHGLPKETTLENECIQERERKDGKLPYSVRRGRRREPTARWYVDWRLRRAWNPVRGESTTTPSGGKYGDRQQETTVAVANLQGWEDKNELGTSPPLPIVLPHNDHCNKPVHERTDVYRVLR